MWSLSSWGLEISHYTGRSLLFVIAWGDFYYENYLFIYLLDIYVCILPQVFTIYQLDFLFFFKVSCHYHVMAL